MKAILLKLQDGMHASWSAQAKELGLSLSAWIRLRCTRDQSSASRLVRQVNTPSDARTAVQELISAADAAGTVQHHPRCPCERCASARSAQK